MKSKAFIGRSMATAAAFFAITIPIFARSLEKNDWSVWQITAARGIFGAIFIGLLYRKTLIQGHAYIKVIIAYAVLGSISIFLWIYSTLHAPLGIALTLLFMSPIWVVLYEWLVEKKKQPGTMLAALVAFISTIFITSSYQSGEIQGPWGIITAILNSFTFSAMLIVGRQARNKVPSEALAFWTLILISFCFGWSIPQAHWNASSLLNAIGIGVISSGFMHLCTTKALKLIPASEVSVIMYLEVALGWILGRAIYQERIDALAVIGTCAVFLATIIIWRQSSKSQPRT